MTRASMSLYAAGTAPWDGLRFARDEAVYTIGPGGTGSREAQMLDLTEAQRFASGVIQARSATNLETIGFRPARERLTFSREADGITVLNGLGVPIRALTYRTGNRLHHLPDPVMPGEKGRLVAGGVRTAGLIPADVPQAPRFQALFQRQPDGSYLAVLDRSPFWTAGVSDVDERDSFHVVIGWVDGQP